MTQLNFKIILDSSKPAGKTTWVRSIDHSSKKGKPLPTLGVEVTPIRVGTSMGEVILNMWDLGSRYRCNDEAYYRDAHGVMDFGGATNPFNAPMVEEDDVEELLRIIMKNKDLKLDHM